MSLVGCVQLLPLLWWSARGRLREPRVVLFAAWGAYAILLLVVVQAPQDGAGIVVGQDLAVVLLAQRQLAAAPLAEPDPVARATAEEAHRVVALAHIEQGAAQGPAQLLRLVKTPSPKGIMAPL